MSSPAGPPSLGRRWTSRPRAALASAEVSTSHALDAAVAEVVVGCAELAGTAVSCEQAEAASVAATTVIKRNIPHPRSLPTGAMYRLRPAAASGDLRGEPFDLAE